MKLIAKTFGHFTDFLYLCKCKEVTTMTYKFNRRFPDDSCHKPTKQRKVSAEWSSRSSISPTSNRVRRGSKWGPWCSKFPILRPSPPRNGEPSCRTKSTLFTDVWGTHKRPFLVPFQGLFKPSDFPPSKLRLSTEETSTFPGANSGYPRSLFRTFSTHAHFVNKILLASDAWDKRDSHFYGISLPLITSLLYIIYILYIIKYKLQKNRPPLFSLSRPSHVTLHAFSLCGADSWNNVYYK